VLCHRDAVIELPSAVVSKAQAVGAHRWLTDLDELVASLVDEWQLTLGSVFPDGTEALVMEATLPDATSAVLKLLVPRGEAVENEITVLRLADGEGCARLLRDDTSRGALLLERLGPSLHDLGLPLAVRLEVMTDAAARVWRPADGERLPTGAEKGQWLIDHILRLWDVLDRPCSEQAVDHAMACAQRRIAAHDDERAVLVHGDVHQWNTLQAGDGFKLIDPDGLLAEAEYDLGIMMREDPVELMEGDPFERAHWLAQRTGCDATATWEWGVVERVSTGLVCTQIGLQPLGRQMLAAADTIAR